MASPSLAEFSNERGNPGTATMDGRRHPPVGFGTAEHRRAEAAHRLRVCLLAAALAASLPATPISAQDEIGLDDLISRVAAYVTAYVDDLSNVVMEEHYRQTYYPWSGGRVRRRLVSELLLMRVGGDGPWVGFRDVVEVDGRELENRGDRLVSLFVDDPTGLDDESSALARARGISEESARYNLGETHRTFNLPTYSLLFLHPANLDRFRFERMRSGREGCAGAATAMDVHFEEVAYPTMTRGFGDIDLPTRGRFCIDPESGRVLEAEFELRHPAMVGRGATDARARVSFGLEPRLNLLVPTEMRDSISEYRGPRMAGTARYWNYRQFDVVVSENTDLPSDEDVSPR